MELREATARAAVLQNDSADAHERATAARRRMPELEAKKKAAAASRVRHGLIVMLMATQADHIAKEFSACISLYPRSLAAHYQQDTPSYLLASYSRA